MKKSRLLAIAIPSMLMANSLMADARTVEITTEDGFRLAATLWQEDASAPGVLLLHQCDRDRTMYDELGDDLAAAGFRVLAIDFRGLGDSTGEGFDLGQAGTEEDWNRVSAKFPDDAETAYRFLREQGDGESEIVGALGASCGGREVLTLAKNHSELRLLGLFSTSLSSLETRDVLQLGGRLLLLITSKGDVAPNSAAGTIAYRARGRSTLILLDGSSHGYPLLEENPDLASQIVDWYRGSLEDLH